MKITNKFWYLMCLLFFMGLCRFIDNPWGFLLALLVFLVAVLRPQEWFDN